MSWWLAVALWSAAAGVHAQEQPRQAADPIERPPTLEADPPRQLPYKPGLALTYVLPPMLIGIGAAADNIPAFSYAAIPVAVFGAPLYLVGAREGSTRFEGVVLGMSGRL